MLTSTDARKDLKEYVELDRVRDNYFQYGVFKGIHLIIKLLIGMRINQEQIKRNLGIKDIESRRPDNEEKTD